MRSRGKLNVIRYGLPTSILPEQLEDEIKYDKMVGTIAYIFDYMNYLMLEKKDFSTNISIKSKIYLS